MKSNIEIGNNSGLATNWWRELHGNKHDAMRAYYCIYAAFMTAQWPESDDWYLLHRMSDEFFFKALEAA